MKRAIVSLATLSVVLFACLSFADENDPIQLRRGISNLFHEASQYEEVTTFCDCDAVPSVEGGQVGEMPITRKMLPDLSVFIMEPIGMNIPFAVKGSLSRLGSMVFP